MVTRFDTVGKWDVWSEIRREDTSDGEASMTDFMYPTQADNNHEWFLAMLNGWQKSSSKYLCFPFFKYKPYTLPPDENFWMFMYYRESTTDIEYLKGKVKYRIHVVKLTEEVIRRPDVFDVNFGGRERVWFLCDRAEYVVKDNGNLLTLEDFEHQDKSKVLTPTMRSSIPPVSCTQTDLQIRKSWP